LFYTDLQPMVSHLMECRKQKRPLQMEKLMSLTDNGSTTASGSGASTHSVNNNINPVSTLSLTDFGPESAALAGPKTTTPVAGKQVGSTPRKLGKPSPKNLRSVPMALQIGLLNMQQSEVQKVFDSVHSVE